ncbi:putative transcriptional regulator [Aurantimicrobium minutum]|uniref:ribbon-helix-helix domain-containing protein n=1 Tax=Aurantimicrobium minutum TaxID=708131 RepID=UPI0024731A93|nr:ribbon-helix-helix domain-containing protein [Aurantimicrobium minutum]MDH6532401.1 putative transcriptional regulator [Aurantimicrobium minutum]
MLKNESINGVPVTEEDISAWVAEAEAGIDVPALKKRGRGRPGRGAAASQTIAVRLTAEELARVDEQAQRNHSSRSDFIRSALLQYSA